MCREKIFRAMMFCLLTVITGVCIYAIRLCYPKIAVEFVVINEVCSNNFSVIADKKGNYSDYIELFNPGTAAVLMEGCFLSDEEDMLQKHSLADVEIPAGGYALIHLNDISAEGDRVFLSRTSDGKIVDSVLVPEISYNTVYARVEDGGDEWAQMSATPAETNENGEKARIEALKDPDFNRESGFYDAPFELSLTAEDGEIIYYTLDGSKPDTDDLVYQEPLRIDAVSEKKNVYAAREDLSPTNGYIPGFPVDKATVVRAVSYDPQKDVYSDVVTKVYFVGFEQRAEYAGLPIVSIVSDPENLFDAEYGIYGNGEALEAYKAQSGLKDGELLSSFTDEAGNVHHLYMASNAFHEGKEWEREASFAWFDETHVYCFSQDVGIRVSGQSTRGAAQKSLNVFGRDIYDGRAEFPYEFFEGTSYSTIKLRNGGSDNAGSKIRDAFLESLCEERDVSIQRSMPCAVFLNGEYWGIYNLRERYKEEYLANYYDVNKNNVWIIDSGNANVGGEDAQSAYNYMVEWISAVDMSAEENYQAACELIDVQSLIDYYCINLYVDNQDMSFGQNMALWRTANTEDSVYGDCKWRWMLFDMDISMNQFDSNTFAFSPRRDGNDLMDEPVIKSLMANEGFRKQFSDTFMEIADTVFDYDTVHRKLMEWKEIYEVQVTKSHQRFFSEEFSPADFEIYISEMDEFFRYRYVFITECLKEELRMTDVEVPE